MAATAEALNTYETSGQNACSACSGMRARCDRLHLELIWRKTETCAHALLQRAARTTEEETQPAKRETWPAKRKGWPAKRECYPDRGH